MRVMPTICLLLVLLVVVLAGCGSGGDDSSPSASTARQSGEESKRARSTKSDSKPLEPRRSAPTDPKPLPNQGAKAVAPEVPVTRGEDNSIQKYGVEAPSSERVEVASTTQAYLGAQAQGQWDEACTYLWAPVRQRLASLSESLPASKGKGCGVAMAGLLAKKSQAKLRSAAEIEVLSLRVKGSRAFVIYRDGKGEPFNLPLIEANGEWKITSLAGIGLVL